MDDHEAMLAIQKLLDGKPWSAETVDEVAAILIQAGYAIHDVDGDLREDL